MGRRRLTPDEIPDVVIDPGSILNLSDYEKHKLFKINIDHWLFCYRPTFEISVQWLPNEMALGMAGEPATIMAAIMADKQTTSFDIMYCCCHGCSRSIDS